MIPEVAPPLTSNPYGDHESREELLVPNVANPLTARMHKGINTTADEGQTPIVCFDETQITHPENRSVPRDQSPTLALQARVPAIAGMAVRRLTPLECSRLQGFPDDYFDGVPGRSDSAVYKALGNSMAVPVMRWIGERIRSFDKTKGIAHD